jgi:hypothetical protein
MHAPTNAALERQVVSQFWKMLMRGRCLVERSSTDSSLRPANSDTTETHAIRGQCIGTGAAAIPCAVATAAGPVR